MTGKPRKLVYNVLLLSTMIIWAGSFIFIKVGLEELSPFNLAFYRFLLASPLLTAYVYTRGKFKLPGRSDFVPLTILALSGVTLLYIFQFLALLFTTATNASILINTSVIFIAILAFLSGERITVRRSAGILISFAGISLVVSKGSFEFFTSKTFYGDMLMVLDGLLWAVYTILGKKLLEKYGSENLTANIFLIGTALLLPFALWEGLRLPTSFNLYTISAILYLSVLCSVFAYLVWYHALFAMESTVVAVYVYLVPLFTAIIAHFVLGENIGIFTVIGGSLTILGIFLVEHRNPAALKE